MRAETEVEINRDLFSSSVFKASQLEQLVKNLPANAGDARDVGSIPGLGRSPGEGKGNFTPVFFPGEPHRQRSLVGYSPWGHKESDTAECTGHTHHN